MCIGGQSRCVADGLLGWDCIACLLYDDFSNAYFSKRVVHTEFAKTHPLFYFIFQVMHSRMFNVWRESGWPANKIIWTCFFIKKNI